MCITNRCLEKKLKDGDYKNKKMMVADKFFERHFSLIFFRIVPSVALAGLFIAPLSAPSMIRDNKCSSPRLISSSDTAQYGGHLALTSRQANKQNVRKYPHHRRTFSKTNGMA